MNERGEDKVVALLYRAIDEVNEYLGDDKKIVKSLSTELLGENSGIDSVWLVTLISAAESRIEDDLGVRLTLADERAMHHVKSPFKTVGSMAEYINGLLRGK